MTSPLHTEQELGQTHGHIHLCIHASSHCPFSLLQSFGGHSEITSVVPGHMSEGGGLAWHTLKNLQWEDPFHRRQGTSL